MKKKFKVAILGTGHIAEKFHIPAWIRNKDCEIVCLCDKNISKLKKISKKFKIKKFYTDYKIMLKKEKIDVINISTPPNLHFQNILESLKKNINIFVEKPFVIHSGEFSKIKNYQKEKKNYIQCALHQRFRPISEAIKNSIRRNEIGKIYYVNILHRKFRNIPQQSFTFSNKKYSGGGPLIDLGSHYFDLVFWILNFPKINKVNCTTNNIIFSRKNMKKYLPFKKFSNEEACFGNIILKNKSYINFEMNYAINTKAEDIKIEFFGEKGSISWPSDSYYTLRKNKLIKKKFIINDNLASDLQIAHFLKNINNYKVSNKNLKEYGFTVSLIESLYKSAKN